MNAYWKNSPFRYENYLFGDPKHTHDMGDFVFKPLFKHYNPKLHRTNKNNVSAQITEILTCSCGRSAWEFTSENSLKRRVDIMAKKSRINYPKVGDTVAYF
jgi:hypothetical protein